MITGVNLPKQTSPKPVDGLLPHTCPAPFASGCGILLCLANEGCSRSDATKGCKAKR